MKNHSVYVLFLAMAAFGAAAEFAEGDDEGFAEEAALVEVFEERAQALVEHGAGFSLHAFGEALVVVPGAVVGVGDFRPDDFDDACAGFDEAAREEEALAKGVAAVAVAEFFAFGGEIGREVDSHARGSRRTERRTHRLLRVAAHGLRCAAEDV